MYPGMWRYPTDPDLCCIYRVPNRLREVKPEAYTPQLVIIGPLHHSLKAQALKALELGDDITYKKSMDYLNMEEHKKNYLAEFAERVDGKKTINGFKKIIKEEEEKIRASYQESTAWIQSPDFVEMVLHDSVFIIELILRRFGKGKKKKRDPLSVCLSLKKTVYKDLIMLENQLPYFILEKLFDPIVPSIWPSRTFRGIVINYFNLKGKIGDNSKFRHFTDLFRCVRVEKFPTNDVSIRRHIDHMYNAEKLDSVGIKFKAVGDELSLRVSFENGCLEIPCLKVDDILEMKLRNIMALEQCHYPDETLVCNYVFFLDYIIDTDKDVDLLVEKGIINGYIKQPTKVAKMVNNLVRGNEDSDSYYCNTADEVNKYYKSPVNRSKAVLKIVYFGNPWIGTATIAVMLLLVMTFIEIVASMTRVMQNRC